MTVFEVTRPGRMNLLTRLPAQGGWKRPAGSEKKRLARKIRRKSTINPTVNEVGQLVSRQRFDQNRSRNKNGELI